mmetsp:Transcript_13239/g.25350  ORF Transcript_13239/g.25350 Transcript_13239/m.25350 type:complete len:183 (-) Transcript_13239:144-692(-)|eukprot:CAMPEP_0114224252 /NCGR_PEP_ID=MMETSP0058-20121206/1_1 /TAXON_ID=36894 /ORGANISM="Pyramimonas parkeae, CCMP726" /LENGTH=182 /DNA_ID=CAMNT_0001334701 /DNA_START=314 /DNA_END=862 /DNA_ORIENTATION=+
MRKLKHHEQKLLKKVNFLEWKSEHGSREVAVMRRYHLQDREDYKRYNKICGMITRMVALLRKMDARDPTRVDLTQALLAKLHAMGVTPTEKGLSLCDHLSVSSFCRRRLAVMLVRLRMAETLREAVTFIEQGHIRVGPETVTDPAFLVTRTLEDFVTWVDTSKIKRKVMKYNDKLDDYDLLN